MKNLSFELKDIHVQFLDKDLLSIPQMAIYQFDRIGIVGKNGAGKTTLLKLLTGQFIPQQGYVNALVDYFYFEQTSPAVTQDNIDIALAHKLKAVDPHSGGEQTRLKLTQAFSHYYEALLFDEPTAHLDQDGVRFLQEQLRYYYGAVVLVSHDRNLLDSIVTTIWEVNDGHISVYSGNYSDYAAQKEREKQEQAAAHEKYIREKAHLEKAVAEKMNKAEKITEAKKMAKKETKAKANRMFETKSKGTSQKAVYRSAKAMEKRIEQLPVVEKVKDDEPLHFKQSKALELHNKVPVMMQDLTLVIGEKVLLDQCKLQVRLQDKIAITGPNGSGKSTFLQAIIEKHPNIVLSPKVKIGHFSQLAYQNLPDETVWSFIKTRSEYSDAFIRIVLHQMQFEQNDLQKRITVLSGGERIRLLLSQLFLGQYNILLLDEATNFLDMNTKEALANFIRAYDGTILFVSHDDYFVKQVATRIIEIKDSALIEV